MLRIALHGPMYSGKTTLSRQLVSHHGFTLVNYTDYLKQLAARALTHLGQWTSVEMIKADKAKYRSFLQDLGSLLDFDGGAFVEECLFEQASSGPDHLSLEQRIVFDNVRTQAQLDILDMFNFRLVRLEVPEDVQLQRALEAGISATELARVNQHSCEQPLAHQPGEIAVVSGPHLDDAVLRALAWGVAA